jgi:hypothetical protein
MYKLTGMNNGKPLITIGCTATTPPGALTPFYSRGALSKDSWNAGQPSSGLRCAVLLGFCPKPLVLDTRNREQHMVSRKHPGGWIGSNLWSSQSFTDEFQPRSSWSSTSSPSKRNSPEYEKQGLPRSDRHTMGWKWRCSRGVTAQHVHAGDTSCAHTSSAAPVCALRAHIGFRNRHALAYPRSNKSRAAVAAPGRAHTIRLVDGTWR